MILSDQLLAQILAYGSIAVGIIVMAAAIGIPFPSTIIVLATGAFIQQGFLDLFPTLPTAFAFVVLGDTLSYLLGYTSRRATQRFIQSPIWSRAENYFQEHGAIAIFLTRCLVTPLAIPTNLIAGGSHFPLYKFVGYAAAGEFTWLVGYGLLGYLFGSQWEYVSDLVSNLSGTMVGLVLFGFGVYSFLRQLRKKSQLIPAESKR